MELSKNYNPDILTCISNLSSDEVFTPPEIAKLILDNLPKEIWEDENTKFLDPVSKTGVFLREITSRLIGGLEKKIPNLEKRINHILRNQVYGLSITELTSLISRRTLYCSKYANSEFSISKFNDVDGNIKFINSKHQWNQKNVCEYCGVNKELYDRNKKLENYAYSFIHEQNLDNIFDMKFDVIIGNPPYVDIKALDNDLVKFATVDLAVSTRESADYTVIGVFGHHIEDDKLFLLDMFRDRVEAPDIIPQIKRMVGIHNLEWVGIERAGYQLALVQFARREGLKIKELRADKDKRSRALPLSAKMERGQVYFPTECDWVADVERELLTFPVGEHDDIVDVLAYACLSSARKRKWEAY